MNPIALPDAINDALRAGATLAISISGGKDSQALLAALVAAREVHGWPGPLFAIHAHLGRMEWPQTLGHCQRICERSGVELVVVTRPQGDLLAEMQQRMEKLRGAAPHWPSATARYCTADQKRNPIDKALRALHWPSAANRYCTSHQKVNQIDKALRRFSVVISAEGTRAAESYARAKKPAWEPRQQLVTRNRTAYTWRPLLHWSEADVWEACGTSQADLDERRMLWHMGWEEEALDGWPAHPAYVMGNQRLSCALCVLASRSDLENGARHNPELLQELIKMERESGFTFRQGLALSDLNQ